MPREIIFSTEENLKQPKGALIVEKPQEQDHVLGATGPEFEVLCEDGQWADFAPDPELQRNRFGDTFMCVSFSKNNIDEFILRKRYNEVFNFSDLFLGVGSGTVRGRGNSKRAVAEWKRLHGYVLEGDYPFTSETTMDEAYKPLTKALLAAGMKGLDLMSFNYKWLVDNSAQSIMGGLRFSPVQVDVTNYKMKDGLVIWNPNSPDYNHEVAIFGYIEGKEWWVYDSENDQFLRYAWNYPFGSPMIHSCKRNMNVQIYKKKGQAGLAVKAYGEPSLIVFSGGSLTGEAQFKSIYGIEDFKNLPIKEVDEWPFPIRHILNCTPYRGN